MKSLKLVLKVSLFFSLFFPAFVYSQETLFKLQGQDLTTKEILNNWTELTKRPLNYRADDLSQEKFTFSVEGTYDEITNKLLPLLGFKSKVIDDLTIITKASEEIKLPEPIIVQVFDEDKRSLPFAHVSIESLGILDVTSINGKVTLEYLLAPSDTMKIQYIGYEDRYLTIGKIKSGLGKVNLKPSSEAISEIIIIGSTSMAQPLENIDTKDFPQASSVDQDALFIAQNLPGISNPSESFQDLIIRGGSPDQVQYKWNGIRILQSSHFFGKASSINPYMVEKMEISKDGYSASSSGTISGGLHMKTKNIVDSLNTSFHLNMLYANLGVSIPISSKLSAKFAIRQSLPEMFQSPLAKEFLSQTFQFGKIPDEQVLVNSFNLENFVRSETGIRFGDRQISIVYKPNSKLSLNLDFVHIDNKFNFKTISEELDISTKDELIQTNYGYHLAARNIWSPQFSTTFDLSHSNYDYHYLEMPETLNQSLIQREQTNIIGLYNYSVSNKFVSSFFSANAGYEFNTWDSEVIFANREENVEDLYENDSQEHAIYLTLRPELGSKLLLDLGFRWSAYNKSAENSKLLEPRIHLKYKLNSQVQFHGHYGKYHQYLSRRNFFTPLHGDNGFWYLSDESAIDFLDYIDIIRSTQFGGGIDFSKNIFDFSFDFYRKKIFNIWSSSLDLSIDENPFRVSDIEIYGVELMAKYHVRNHQLQTSYEYTNEQVLFDNIVAPSLSPFSQPHRFSLVYQYKWKILTSSIQYNFAKGRPFSQASGLTIDSNGANIDFENILVERVDDYHRVDVSFATSPLGKKLKQSFGIQINNLLNRNNTIKNQYFINLLTEPVELGKLEKFGISRSINIFWEITF